MACSPDLQSGSLSAGNLEAAVKTSTAIAQSLGCLTPQRIANKTCLAEALDVLCDFPVTGVVDVLLRCVGHTLQINSALVRCLQ